MTEETKDLIKSAVKATMQEIRKEKEGYCFRNTVLLLRNYELLKSHVEYAISSPSDVRSVEEKLSEIEEDLGYDVDFLESKPDAFIESILISKVRTALMVAHIDSMIKKLHDNCKAGGRREQEKFAIFEAVYIQKRPLEEVGEQMNYSRSQIYRSSQEIVRRLSVLLWGIGGLRGIV